MERRARGVLFALVLGFPLALSASLGAETEAAAGSLRQNHTCVFDHMNLWTAPGACRPQAKSYPPRIRGKVRRAIYDSALTFGVPFKVLLRIGKCESALNPRASNGTHFGLFQFAPDTFKRASRLMRVETGVQAHSYWNPLDASYAAGYLFATGGSVSWSCEPSLR